MVSVASLGREESAPGLLPLYQWRVEIPLQWSPYHPRLACRCRTNPLTPHPRPKKALPSSFPPGNPGRRQAGANQHYAENRRSMPGWLGDLARQPTSSSESPFNTIKSSCVPQSPLLHLTATPCTGYEPIPTCFGTVNLEMRKASHRFKPLAESRMPMGRAVQMGCGMPCAGFHFDGTSSSRVGEAHETGKISMDIGLDA